MFLFQEAAQRREQKKIEKKQMKMKQIKVKAMWKTNIWIQAHIKSVLSADIFSPSVSHIRTSGSLSLTAPYRHPAPLWVCKA